MNTNNPKNTDHHDRLLDTALREVVGQETPPDLSKKILAAAGETSQPLATLGDDAMSMQQRTRRKRNFFIGAVLAASLLVGAMITLPAFQARREAARRSDPVAHTAETKEPANRKDVIVDRTIGRTAKKDLPSQARTAVTTPDQGTVLFSTKPKGEAWRQIIDQNKNEKLMMAVTPHIIIQEEEEERLGISSEGVVPPDFPLDLDKPYRNSSFGLTVPQFDKGHPSAGNGVPQLQPPAQTGKETFSFSMGFGRGAKRQIERWGYRGGGGYGGEYGGGVGGGGGGGLSGGAESIRLGYAWKPRNSHREWGATMGRQKKFDRGQGPAASGNRYTRIYENPFLAAEGEQAVSTFSIDVDTASYANVRQFLMQSGQLPPPDAVRIEELINYFSYDYTPPTDDTPFAAHVEVAGCPWHSEHRLVRVGIKGHEIANEKRPQSNLVFLIDVSGSMNQPNKLPLLVEGLKMLTRELGEDDRVAIIVYASSEGLALPSTRGDQQDTILAALEKLRAGGSTAGGAGIQLAYKIASENFIEGGVNRVILATDGDFNVGTTSTAELERLAESNAQETGVFLTVLGFGRGNLNDAMMEAISGKGNGNYHYVDNRAEARKVLVEEIAGTLVTIAKDVKIQIEFNPAQVAAYRLIGYENRMLETQDFNDDKKDAGEIGAGHTVTAIYEVVPAGVKKETPKVDPLKYQLRAEVAAPSEAAPRLRDGATSDELLTLKIRYKQPDGDKSTKLEFPITDNGQPFAEATDDFKFASAVASFGMLLRHSEHSGNASYGAVSEIAEESLGKDLHGYRAEFLQLVRQAKVLAGE